MEVVLGLLLQGLLKALSTATARPESLLAGFPPTKAFSVMLEAKLSTGAVSTHSSSLRMLLELLVALDFIPAYFYALPTDPVLQQIQPQTPNK